MSKPAAPTAPSAPAPAPHAAATHATNATRVHTRGDFAVNLGLIVVLAALAALGVAYAIDAMSPARHKSAIPSQRVEKTLGGHVLSIPKDWLRFPGQDKANFTDRLDLRLPLKFSGKRDVLWVDARLVPAARALPSAKLLDSVYAHNFTDTTVTGPAGLIGKPLKPVDGFQNETVWYDPLTLNPFVAKCMAPIGDQASPRCLRTVYLEGGVALTLDFSASLLTHWRQFDAALQDALSTLGERLAR